MSRIYIPTFLLSILAPFDFIHLIIIGLLYHSQIIEKMDQEHRDREAKKEVVALREEIAWQSENHNEKEKGRYDRGFFNQCG